MLVIYQYENVSKKRVLSKEEEKKKKTSVHFKPRFACVRLYMKQQQHNMNTV